MNENNFFIEQAIYADGSTTENNENGYGIVAKTCDEFSDFQDFSICHDFSTPDIFKKNHAGESGEIFYLMPVKDKNKQYYSVTRTSHAEISNTGRESIIAHHFLALQNDEKKCLVPVEMILVIYGFNSSRGFEKDLFKKSWNEKDDVEKITLSSEEIPKNLPYQVFIENLPTINYEEKKIIINQIVLAAIELLSDKPRNIIIGVPNHIIKIIPVILAGLFSILPDSIQRKTKIFYPIWENGFDSKPDVIFAEKDSPYFENISQENYENRYKIIFFKKEPCDDEIFKVLEANLNYNESLNVFSIRRWYNKYPNIIINENSLKSLLIYRNTEIKFSNMPTIDIYKDYMNASFNLFLSDQETLRKDQENIFLKACCVFLSKKHKKYKEFLTICELNYEDNSNVKFFHNFMDQNLQDDKRDFFDAMVDWSQEIKNPSFFITILNDSGLKTNFYNACLRRRIKLLGFFKKIKEFTKDSKQQQEVDGFRKDYVSKCWEKFKSYIKNKKDEINPFIDVIQEVFDEWKEGFKVNKKYK